MEARFCINPWQQIEYRTSENSLFPPNVASPDLTPVHMNIEQFYINLCFPFQAVWLKDHKENIDMKIQYSCEKTWSILSQVELCEGKP